MYAIPLFNTQSSIRAKLTETISAHITDSKSWTAPPELRHGIHTNTELAWHTDMGVDILALHVRGLAEKGGHTYVASSWTIFRELVDSYPKVLEVLSKAVWPIQM